MNSRHEVAVLRLRPTLARGAATQMFPHLHGNTVRGNCITTLAVALMGEFIDSSTHTDHTESYLHTHQHLRIPCFNCSSRSHSVPD